MGGPTQTSVSVSKTAFLILVDLLIIGHPSG
jgi:hypothetical protein